VPNRAILPTSAHTVLNVCSEAKLYRSGDNLQAGQPRQMTSGGSVGSLRICVVITTKASSMSTLFDRIFFKGMSKRSSGTDQHPIMQFPTSIQLLIHLD
jgi:hypothetical protein